MRLDYLLAAAVLSSCGPGLKGASDLSPASEASQYAFSANFSLVEDLEDVVDVVDGHDTAYRLLAYLLVAGEANETQRLPIDLKRNGDADFDSYADVVLTAGSGSFSGLFEVPGDFEQANESFQVELSLVDESGNRLLSKVIDVDGTRESAAGLSADPLRPMAASDIREVAVDLTSTICTVLGYWDATQKLLCDSDAVSAITASVVSSLSSDLSVSQLTGRELAEAAQSILYFNYKTNAGGIRDVIESTNIGKSGFEANYRAELFRLTPVLSSDSGLSYFSNATQMRDALTEMLPRVPFEFTDTDDSDKIGGQMLLPNWDDRDSEATSAGRCKFVAAQGWSPDRWYPQMDGLPDCDGSFVAYFGGESRASAKGTLIGAVPFEELIKTLRLRGFGNSYSNVERKIRKWVYTIPSGTSVPAGATRIWWIHKNASGTETGRVGSVSLVNKMITPNARLEFTGGARFDLDADQGAAPDTVELTVKNVGTAAATLGTISDAGLGLDSPFSLSSATCTTGQTLAVNATCSLTVSLATGTAGNFAGSLSLAYDNGVQVDDVGVGVTLGGYVRLVREANLVTSGTLSTTAGVGTSSIITVTVSNSGNRSAGLGTFSDATLGLAAPFSYASGGSCVSGGSLAAGSSCTLRVSFTPTAAGAASDTLTIPYTKPGTATAAASLSGTGTVAVLTITPSGTLGFDATNVGQTDDLTVTLSNTGTGVATLGTLSTGALGLAAPFSYVTGGTCASGGTLAASASCTLILRFTPTSGVVSTDTLEVSYNNGAVQTSASRGVSGQGTLNLGELVASIGNSYAFTGDGGFGPVDGSAVITLTFVNQGGGSVSGLSLNLLGTFSSELALENDTCSGATITPSANCSVDVRWTPSGGEQFMSDELLRINYNDGATSQTLDTVNFGGFAGT